MNRIQNFASNRIVAIVGRPNVGKSALFNRIVGRRIAIVHEERGVTRDRLMSQASWGGERFVLVDTGGIGSMDGAAPADEIEAGVERQVEAAIQEAAAVIFVVDGAAGLVPLDEEAAGRLRRAGRRVVVAVNKCDAPAQDERSDEFRKFGFPVFPVSALHNRGIETLMKEILRNLPPWMGGESERPLTVAVVGRPNAGKSSFINRLLGSERVIVSPVPGTTRDSIETLLVLGEGNGARRYALIDTAGARSHVRNASAVEVFGRMRMEASVRRSNVAVLMLDAVQGPGDADKKLGSLIMEHDKGCVVAVNKWDLSDGIDEEEYREAVFRTMPFLSFCPVVFISALTGLNMDRVIDAIDHTAAQTRASLPTGLLNRVLSEAQETVHAPSEGGRRLKIYYAVQTGVEPVRVRCYVNDPCLLTANYRSYLVRKIRERFELTGAPVVLDAKPRTRGMAGNAGMPEGTRRAVRTGSRKKNT